MGDTLGRRVVLVLANKSGGSLAKGDVVIIDSSNDSAVTTTTTGATTQPVGVVIEENGIANNATGRVQWGGLCPLVNVQASVTRGHYGQTYTVAKQATGNATRQAGSFCRFLTGGTTPQAYLFGLTDASSSAGAVATDTIWDAAGDLAVGTGADTASRLAIGATATYPRSNGTTLAYAFPPGHEFDYTEFTSGVNVTATSEATANTIVTGSAVSYDGSTPIMVEFYSPAVAPQPTNGIHLLLYLYDGSSSIGIIGQFTHPGTNQLRLPLLYRRRITPSNASHTYSIRGSTGSGTAVVGANTGGAGTVVPGFIRQFKAA